MVKNKSQIHRLAVVTLNQPRHRYLIEKLSSVVKEVVVLQEVFTLFPGSNPDFFKKSEIMQDYFSRVLKAERKIFGGPTFFPEGVSYLPMKFGDINSLNIEDIQKFTTCDAAVVFGGSFIKGALGTTLEEMNAVNVHMGISPFYRGSSCNFWAAHDGRHDMVGATIHQLTQKLDGGGILFHALPKPEEYEYFELGMLAARAAVDGLADSISSGRFRKIKPVNSDEKLELRYSRNKEFDDDVARVFLNQQPSAKDVYLSLRDRKMENYVNPYIPK